MSSFKVSRVAHVGLTVSDIERSIQVFRDVLGFELSRRGRMSKPFTAVTGVEHTDIDMALLSHGTESFTVELLYYDTAENLSEGSVVKASSDVGSSHLAFAVDNMDEAIKHLEHLGVKLVGRPQPIPGGPNQGTLVAYLRDWDGHTYELMQPREKATPALHDEEL